MLRIPRPIVRVGETIGKLADAISTWLQVAFVSLSVVFIVIWTIPYLRARLERDKWFDQNSMLDVVALGLILMMGLLRSLHKKMSELSDKRMSELSDRVKQVAEAGSNLIPGGVGQVYLHLRTAIETSGNHRAQSLEVLGLSLYTAWPQVYSWIDDGTLHDINITLYCLSPDFIRSQTSSISADWGRHAQAQIDSIARFQAENADVMKARSITLNLSLYYCFPAVHGFRLGNGEIFIAFSRWSGAAGHRHLADPNYFYERFRSADRTRRAEEYRALFSNWIEEVKHRKAALPTKPPGKI